MVRSRSSSARFAPRRLRLHLLHGDRRRLQYVRAAFCCGYGRLSISGLRIGDTELGEYDEVDTEIRDGVTGDAALTITREQVVEESVGAELIKAYPRDDLGEIVPDSVAVETEVGARPAPMPRVLPSSSPGGWPRRLQFKGKAGSMSVTVRIRQRRIDATDWTVVTTLEVTAQKLEAFYRLHQWTFPSRGRWQVGVTMQTEESTSAQVQQRTSWVALQTIRPNIPGTSRIRWPSSRSGSRRRTS